MRSKHHSLLQIAMRLKHKRFAVYAYLAVCFAVAQLLLVLISWILTAAMPDSLWRSLLSAEGIRWFFGRFQSNMASLLMVWLVLGGMAWGAVRQSGILAFRVSEYRQRIAMWLVLMELAVFVAIILALTLVPHAILLNVMGELYPSSFSQCIVPYVCFCIVVMSMSFGGMSGNIKSLPMAFELLVAGIRYVAPLLVLYVLGAQFYFSLLFVFG